MQKLIISFLAGLALSLSTYSMGATGRPQHIHFGTQAKKPAPSETSCYHALFKS